jgi:hypothetical protein
MLFDFSDTFQGSAIPSASAPVGRSSGTFLSVRFEVSIVSRSAVLRSSVPPPRSQHFIQTLQPNTLLFRESLHLNSHAFLQTVIRDSENFSITAVWFVVTTSTNESSISSGLSIGLIAGAAAIVVVVVIAFVLFFFKRRHKDTSGRFSEGSASTRDPQFGSDTTLDETLLNYHDATTFEAMPSTLNTFGGASETPTGRDFVRLSLL